MTRWDDFNEEWELAAAIRRELLTADDSAWLASHNVTVEDALNGRFRGDLMNDVEAMFARWNTRIGSYHFGFYLGNERGQPIRTGARRLPGAWVATHGEEML